MKYVEILTYYKIKYVSLFNRPTLIYIRHFVLCVSYPAKNLVFVFCLYDKRPQVMAIGD